MVFKANRLLNFFSNHPNQHKIGVVDNLINRVFKLSPLVPHYQNLTTVTNILRDSQYPSRIINSRIRKFICKNDPKCNANEEIVRADPITYKGISFVSPLSIKVGRTLCNGLTDVRVGYKPFKSNSSNFSMLKDKCLDNERINSVYRIPCLGDGFSSKKCDLCYIGQSGNKLATRMEQHLTDIKKSNNDQEKCKGQTALVRHFQDGHAPDFDNVSILMTESNAFKRKVLESLSILTNNSVNFRQDTENISKIYHSLLDVQVSD